MKTVNYRRSALADLLDLVRRDLAARVPHEEIEARLAGYPDVNQFPEQHGALFAYNTIGWPALEPLKKCDHDERNDNCGVCAPRWGWTGPKAVAK